MSQVTLEALDDGIRVWMTKRGACAGIESASLSAAVELENRTQILAGTTGDLQHSVKTLPNRPKNPSSAY